MSFFAFGRLCLPEETLTRLTLSELANTGASVRIARPTLVTDFSDLFDPINVIAFWLLPPDASKYRLNGCHPILEIID